MSSSTLRIQDCMTRSPHSIGADQKVGLARSLMRGHRIRHLPVLRGGRLVGMISERDIYWIETLKEAEGDDLLVSEAMSPSPYAVAPEAPLSEVVREMAEHKYGSAVVLKGQQVVGVFTTTDALAVLAALLTKEETASPAARPA
ncbi:MULTISPECIES: CBS domain-containing protein [Sorangium]|uniref:XRE family transcriptional regulator n=1 Tax=Sorangium cellulosum TaxID=56 RepID=A0A150QL06_SORCE|nr:CBS domain-containing protein [Sorangium cellulosum]KYF68522.1 XRE family transcriptional regulator [Sorangium cellulosum]